MYNLPKVAGNQMAQQLWCCGGGGGGGVDGGGGVGVVVGSSEGVGDGGVQLMRSGLFSKSLIIV